ncbi:cobinamide adenolsyltransferase [Vibrio sp. 10N.261.55.A7]|uniref:PGAP1-like alpha/beta domain-containing protein n=1 Tax=Vibrio sp. 10N.261.55.A7 TaxID=1880851 RepID=UPI000C83C6B7|nr:cobinamide adenolsyltransferase [Vibrio sp. 10N.261.55.A7]PMJ98920.1 cobinamide adenolsyltransferase [Vibrio sp. 10N.261.55.A7]
MKIVFLHGLYMHGVALLPLSQRLNRLGYQTDVVSYNSVNIDAESLFEEIDTILDPFTTNVLVGHSLGGLMIKHYLASRNPAKTRISHVVAIGSPIQGASIAEKLTEMGLGALLGNSPKHGLEKHQDEWSFPQKLGCIAGVLPIGLRPILLDNEQCDGTVTVEETKIEGMTDHLKLNSNHTSLLYSHYIPNQIDHFIQFNCFKQTNAVDAN